MRVPRLYPDADATGRTSIQFCLGGFMDSTELHELCRVWLSDHATKPARECDARDAQETGDATSDSLRDKHVIGFRGGGEQEWGNAKTKIEKADSDVRSNGTSAGRPQHRPDQCDACLAFSDRNRWSQTGALHRNLVSREGATSKNEPCLFCGDLAPLASVKPQCGHGSNSV